jgi:Fe-S cluster biosynthesis and repair protein YggX
MAERMVQCSKLKREAPGLDKPPFPGELGQLIFERVSAEAWKSWSEDMMMKVINEYRLNLVEAEHYETLLTQMRAYLALDDTAVLEVENAERGRG